MDYNLFLHKNLTLTLHLFLICAFVQTILRLAYSKVAFQPHIIADYKRMPIAHTGHITAKDGMMNLR